MKKILVIGIIVLFIGMGIQPAIASVHTTEEINNINPKDYLFNTIIDIVNTPELKELLKGHDNDLLSINIERNMNRKLLLGNPRFFINFLFTKPSMSIEYLDKCYNMGIEITNILGENKVLEIIESVEFKNPETFEKINDIINDNSELKAKATKLGEKNNNLKLDPPYQYSPVICAILELLFAPLILGRLFLAFIFSFFPLFPLLGEFFSISFEIRLNLFMYFMINYECIDWPPY